VHFPRSTSPRFAQEGAKVMAVDRELGLAEETAAMVRREGGDCFAFEADVTRELGPLGIKQVKIEAQVKRWLRPS